MENEDKREEIVRALEPEEIKKLREKIADITGEIEELDDWEMPEENYDEFLDDVYPEVDIAGCKYSVSHILKEVDEVRYNMGKSEQEDEERENQKEELERDLEEAKAELEEYEQGD